MFATNEGQRAVQAVQKKYEPQKTKIDALSNEIDGLKKQLASLPATATAEDRASKQRVIDTKDKELQREAEDAQPRTTPSSRKLTARWHRRCR